MPFRLSGTTSQGRVCLTFEDGRHLLGSAPESGLRLDDPTVSRRHAELVASGEWVEVTDLDSRNGTFLAGRRISRERARGGDQLSFGSVSLLLDWVAGVDTELAVAVSRPPAKTVPHVPDGPGLTVGTGALETFAVQHFPELLRRIGEGATEQALVEAAGAALFATLPAVEVEVTSGEGDGAGVLFQARRETATGEVATVEFGDDSLRLKVAFPPGKAAQLFRPVVEAVGAMLRLHGGRPAVAAPTTLHRPPQLPDPPSVVPEVQRLYAEAARVASGSVGVLILGESGTGKEVLARYVHAASPMAQGPFVALNCAALPRDLLESELFGIEKGVATGVEARPGKFELAHGGTLFLDEIGDMALETQARILRVLQEKEVHRLGGTAPRRAAVRVLAATNQNMPRLLAEGRFRQDLYYRIATWAAELPPLRRRRADIPNLAAHFLGREAARRGIRVRGISRGALDVLLDCAWPGNIRQLEQEVSRAVLFLSEGELLDSSRLSPSLRAAAPRSALTDVLEDAERNAIKDALRASSGDVAIAAEKLGVGRSTLYRRLKALGIDSPEEPDPDKPR